MCVILSCRSARWCSTLSCTQSAPTSFYAPPARAHVRVGTTGRLDIKSILLRRISYFKVFLKNAKQKDHERYKAIIYVSLYLCENSQRSNQTKAKHFRVTHFWHTRGVKSSGRARTKLNLWWVPKVTGPNLVCEPLVVSFPLCFSSSRSSIIIQIGEQEFS